MRASVTCLREATDTRLWLHLNSEEIAFLVKGSVNARAHIRGNVADGIEVQASENSGGKITLNKSGGGAMSIVCSAVFAIPEKIPVTEIPAKLDRNDHGPLIRTDRFPINFIEKSIRRKLGFGNGSGKAPAPVPPQPPVTALVPNPGPAKPSIATIERVTALHTARIDDLREAIRMVNEFMEGCDEVVTLRVEGNRLRAARKIVKLEDFS